MTGGPGGSPGDLGALIREFAFFPNRYAHPSWTEDLLPEPLLRQLASSRRSEGRLAVYLAEQIGFSVGLTYRFDDARQRLWLLPGDQLLLLLRRLGLALNAGLVARTIDRRQALRLRQELDPEDRVFVLKRAPLLVDMAKPAERELPAEDPLPVVFEAWGLGALSGLLAEAPEGVRQRLQLKLPRYLAPRVGGSDEGGGEGAWTLARKIVKDMAPQWNVLFT